MTQKQAGFQPRPLGNELTHLNGRLLPGMYWAPKFFYERYKKPIYITENGMSSHDWVNKSGKFHDPQRIQFLESYLGVQESSFRFQLKGIFYGHCLIILNRNKVMKKDLESTLILKPKRGGLKILLLVCKVYCSNKGL